MSCYISSNNNRVYVALESEYGQAAAVTAASRIPFVKLGAQQVPEQTGRRDKTGSRTFAGMPNRIRRRTHFQLNTFMTQWTDQASAPGHGPLFQAAMGAAPVIFAGGTVAAVTAQTQIQFSATHGLTPGQGITWGGEVRFVTAVMNTTTVFINAPFTGGPEVGGTVGATATYRLATDVGSVTLYDYWDPSTVVQRILNGAAMDVMKVKVNGDFHEFEFSGPAQDLLDSASFVSGEGGLTDFPAEPAAGNFDYTIVPGHLGQVWMGAEPHRFFTLTAADLTLTNNISQRLHEFGSDFARCVAAGERAVRLSFRIFEQDDAQSKELYQAARQRSPIGVMLQLGEQAGQLFGAYMPAMVPEVPEFDDGETRLQWSFKNDRAQGT
ncbi:MAG TPA: hypothetical protein VLN48_16610, partial [Bryobacteraceae bacterium]|nr:hypothetical protein [Bryobacteraceae bacterium]